MGNIFIIFANKGVRGVAMFNMMGGVRGVSHVQAEDWGSGALAMFKVMGGVRGVSHVKSEV